MDEMATVIALLSANLIVLSVVIIALIVVTIVLVIKMNKIVRNIQDTTAHVASATEWLSPVKVFSELATAIRAIRKS